MSTQKLATKDTPTTEVINIVSDGSQLGALVVPTGATSVQTSSGNVAAGVAAAALAGVAAKTNYISGFEVTGAGATAGVIVTVTVAGILGGTLSYTYSFVTGAAVGNVPLIVQYNPPLPASAVNTAITVSCPSSGAGGLFNTVNVHGFVQ